MLTLYETITPPSLAGFLTPPIHNVQVIVDFTIKENGKTCQEIMEEIDKYPISKELKRKLREFIEEFREGENHEQ